MANERVAAAGAGTRSPEAVTIAPLRKEMIPQVERIHAEAFAGYMNTRLGRSYVCAFFNWFLTLPGGIALVALDNKASVLGYVVGAPIDYGPRMNRDLSRIAAVCVAVRPWLLFSKTFWTIIVARLRSYLGLSRVDSRSPYPEPAMSLIAIGVARSARGKKIGLSLLQAFEEQARELGIRSLQLTVYSNNLAARRLYEQSHWMRLPEAPEAKKVVEYVRILAQEANRHACTFGSQS